MLFSVVHALAWLEVACVFILSLPSGRLCGGSPSERPEDMSRTPVLTPAPSPAATIRRGVGAQPGTPLADVRPPDDDSFHLDSAMPTLEPAVDVAPPASRKVTPPLPDEPKSRAAVAIDSVSVSGRILPVETCWAVELPDVADEFEADVTLSNGMTVVVTHHACTRGWFVITKDIANKRHLLARFQPQEGRRVAPRAPRGACPHARPRRNAHARARAGRRRHARCSRRSARTSRTI